MDSQYTRHFRRAAVANYIKDTVARSSSCYLKSPDEVKLAQRHFIPVRNFALVKTVYTGRYYTNHIRALLRLPKLCDAALKSRIINRVSNALSFSVPSIGWTGLLFHT